MKMLIYVITLPLLLLGCATYQPDRQAISIIPMMDTAMNPKGRDMQQDLKECNWHANGVAGAGSAAVGGGMAGAGIGAATGAITAAFLGASVGRTAGFGALMGGLSGAAGGATHSIMTKRRVVSKCMAGRGYSVLD